mgnify:CR=1 FL=1
MPLAFGIQAHDVFATDPDFAGGGFQLAVDVAHKRRFARPRQAHDAKELSFLDLEGGICHAYDTAEPGQNLGLAKPLAMDRGKCFIGTVSKDLPDAPRVDCYFLRHDAAPVPHEKRCPRRTDVAGGGQING